MMRRMLTLAVIATATMGIGFACSGGGGGGGTVATGSSSGGATTPGSGTPGGGTTTPGGGGTTTPGGGGTTTPPPPAPTTPPSGSWLAGDLHVHTRHSDDTDPFGDDIRTTILLAETEGLDYVSISDHRQTSVLTDPQFLNRQTSLVVLAGEEWGGPGHAGAHNLSREPIAHTQDRSAGAAAVAGRIHDVVDDIHAQGGFFVLNHPIEADNPFWWNIDYDRIDGLEVWNGPWGYRAIEDTVDSDIDDWMRDEGLTAAGITADPAIRSAVAVQGGGKNRQCLAFYEALISAGHKLAAIGGGDRHYLFPPGQPTTWVFAENTTAAGITDGIRRGRTWVSRSPRAARVDFKADRNGDAIFETILGDTIPLSTTGTIDFQIAVENADQGKVELVKNGQVIQTWSIAGGSFVTTFSDTPSGPSWYRVNVYERLDMSIPNAQLLRLLVMGVPLQNLGFLGSTIQGLIGQAQQVFATGGPLAVYLLFFGQQLGVGFSPVPTTFLVFDFPDALSKLINLDLQDPDFCRGAVTSAIYAE